MAYTFDSTPTHPVVKSLDTMYTTFHGIPVQSGVRYDVFINRLVVVLLVLLLLVVVVVLLLLLLVLLVGIGMMYP